jgi:thymidylate synthase (FAD)
MTTIAEVKKHQVLDHGYVRFIEAWGRGDAGMPEAGIIEAARQSTQGSFRMWAPYEACELCWAWRYRSEHPIPGMYWGSNGEPECNHKWKNFPRGDEGLLSFLFNNKPQHTTPFEFAGLIIEVQAPIFVFREWHRHRTQSYNEMSARYAPLPALDYVPTIERLLQGSSHVTFNKQAQAQSGAKVLTSHKAAAFSERLKQKQRELEELYQEALEDGVPKELARGAMTVNRYSRMRASANLRNWLGFMTLRADKGAQWEIRQFAHAVGTIISEQMPRTWKLFELARAV